MAKTILSVSRDQILLETRGALLRKTGHRVLSVSSMEDALAALLEEEVDLVVLGHTVPGDQREQLYHVLAESDLRCPVIELYATASPPPSAAQFHLQVHDRSFENDLLLLVSQVLSGTQN